VISVALETVFGVVAAVTAALGMSKAGHKINTDFIERHNGTDRNRNSRKVRKTYCFSKDWDTHEAVGYFTMYSYNSAGPCEPCASAETTTIGAIALRRCPQA